MKFKNDFLLIIFLLILFLPFFISPSLKEAFENFTRQHGLISSLMKFAVLATTGELIGLRISSGHYHKKGFGVIPRAIVWGLLGISIYVSFGIFTKGTVGLLSDLGLDVSGRTTTNRIFLAFCTSTFMNIIFAPVMMTIHKITDTHILEHGGKASCLLKKINFPDILGRLDWQTQWNFIFLRTLPMFWIPAHTVTFLLPKEYRVLFAAILGIILGMILAFANAQGGKLNGITESEGEMKG
jgi:hypothetical protein